MGLKFFYVMPTIFVCGNPPYFLQFLDLFAIDICALMLVGRFSIAQDL